MPERPDQSLISRPPGDRTTVDSRSWSRVLLSNRQYTSKSGGEPWDTNRQSDQTADASRMQVEPMKPGSVDGLTLAGADVGEHTGDDSEPCATWGRLKRRSEIVPGVIMSYDVTRDGSAFLALAPDADVSRSPDGRTGGRAAGNPDRRGSTNSSASSPAHSCTRTHRGRQLRVSQKPLRRRVAGPPEIVCVSQKPLTFALRKRSRICDFRPPDLLSQIDLFLGRTVLGTRAENEPTV